MVDFPAYSDDEYVQLARDYMSFEAGLVGVDLDLDDGSDADMTARLLGALLSMSTRQAEAVMTAASPIKAFGAFLRQHATDYGIGPTLDSVGVDAVKASGYAVVVCTTGSATVPSGLTLRAPDGQTYVTTGSAVAPASATGTVYPGWRLGESRRVFIVGTGNGAGGTTTFTPTIGDALTALPSGELCAVFDAVNADSQQQRFELYNDLNAVPATFTRALAAVVPIEAVTAGRAGNRDPKSTLTVVSPTTGVSTSAYVLYCDGGRDVMTQAEMRTALRDLFATRQIQGKPSEIRDVALQTPRKSLGDVFVISGYFGVASYLVVSAAATFGRKVGAGGSSVQVYVQGRVPRGIKIGGSGMREIAAGATVIDVDCAAGYGPDFTIRNATGTLTGTLGAGVVSLTGVTDITVLPRAGDRVILASAPVGTAPNVQKRAWIKQFKITAVNSTGAGAYDLTLDGTINYGGASVTVTPGGPLGQPVIDALVKSYDTRVPSAPATPLVVFPDLEAASNQGALSRALSAVPGVVDVAVSADASYSMTGVDVWQLGPTTIKMHAS